MAVEQLPGVRISTVRPASFRWLIGLTCAAWALVVTMHFWWAWLWAQLGVLSVPVDTMVWIVAIILTVLLSPVLWRRFHRVWVVVLVTGALLVGGTGLVLSPWHDVLTKAWLRTECGPGDCTAPQPPLTYSWRVTGP